MKKIMSIQAILALSVLVGHQASAVENMEFSGTLVSPPVCVIKDKGGSEKIAVEFGDRMPIDKIDGTNFLKEVPYAISCGTGTSGLDLKLMLTGNKANFGSGGVLQVNGMPNLGIQMWIGPNGSSRQPFTFDSYFDIQISNPPTIWAVPIKKPNSTLEEGPFKATATLLALYQ